MPRSLEPSSDVPESRGPKYLRRFVSSTFAGAILFVSVGSGLLQFRDAFDWTEILIAGLGTFGVAGWAAAAYVAYQSKYVVSAAETLLGAITDRIDVPFVDSWLRGALLNQRALDAYWNHEGSLALEEISCSSVITTRDIKNRLCFRGRNESKSDADGCPILLIGGSVLHFSQLAPSTTCLVNADANADRHDLRLQSLVDLGHFQLAKMVFPTLLPRHGSFNIEHDHEWPGGMTPGVDIMWYPYAAMFSRHTRRLQVDLCFETPLIYIRGYAASLKSGQCALADDQPVKTSDQPTKATWTIEPVDNQVIYFVVFER